MMTNPERVAMGLRCHDCDTIPKVPGAGGFEIRPDGTRVQLMHNGLQVIAGGYHGDWMAKLIQGLRGHHEPQEERLFHEIVRLLPTDATMLELGGFWSYYSLWFLKDCAARRAVVLEPDPSHLALGRKNAALNGLVPVFVKGVAAEGAGPPAPFETETSGPANLPRFSVHSLMDLHGVTILDVLHCDIQGAEHSVLRGCVPLFEEGRIRWVIVSTHHHSISGDPLTHQRCLALLQQTGATIEAEHDVQESFSGDGLIVARFCPQPLGWCAPALSRNRSSTSLFRDPLYDLAAEDAARTSPRPAIDEAASSVLLSDSLASGIPPAEAFQSPTASRNSRQVSHVKIGSSESMVEPIVSLEEAERRIAAVPHWHHRFEIYDGLKTPGSYDPGFMLERLELPADLSGLRALDVGPSDGFFSMHLARRGAQVTAADYRAKDAHGFATMEALTNLGFDYRQRNLYDLTRHELGGFDIVLFLGVLYHLPDMVRALDILRSLCDGRLLLETEYEPDLQSAAPLARYYEAATLANDHTNFWAPNRECVMAMLRDTGFASVRDETWGRRLFVEAKAVGDGRSAKMGLAYGLL